MSSLGGDFEVIYAPLKISWKLALHLIDTLALELDGDLAL